MMEMNLEIESWDRAIPVLHRILPEVQSLDGCGLSMDYVYDLIERRTGKPPECLPAPMHLITEPARFLAVTCKVSFGESDRVFIANDVTWIEALSGPFKCSGEELVRWCEEYPLRINPKRIVFEGDTVFFSEAGMLVVGHEGVYSNILASDIL